MVQFEHALDSSNTIVNVNDLNEARRRDTFTCPDCHSRLFPSLKDDIKARHFRHEADVLCSGETDIHWRLKHAFADAFRFALGHGLSFDAEIEQKHTCVNGCCEKESEWTRSSLTRFDDVRVECRLSHQGQEFIPDCYLTDSTGENPSLFFEVRVTSKNSDAKLASGTPILEMIVRDKDMPSQHEREVKCLAAISGLFLPKDLIQWHSFELPPRKDGLCLIHRAGKAPVPSAPKRVPQYTFTGKSLTPPEVYRGDGSNGRFLMTLTWFTRNGARILWDMDARHYLVIQDGIDHGVFPNHGLAYEFCQAQGARKGDGIGEEF